MIHRMSRTIEIVTTCWKYSRLLSWQLDSLEESWQQLDDPDSVSLTVVCASPDEDPDTHAATLSYRMVDRPVRMLMLDKPQLFNRAIGRNLAAKETPADWVWFCDCDYLLSPASLQTLAETDPGDGKLFFPRVVLTHKNHALGDRYIEAGPNSDIFDPDDFYARTMCKAIGGIQVVLGNVAREQGYCDWPRMQQPVSGDLMSDTRSDRAFRAHLGTPGTPLDLPGVFRIRHSTSGLNRGKGGVERWNGN